ncbi:Coq4 family protein [Pseudomonadales bacterium]|nr:Coq4 family protein [Pseudomonadales bacterium]
MQEYFTELKQYAVQPDLAELHKAVTGAVQGDRQDQALVCGAMIWSAFASPAGIPLVFDVIADAQLGKPLADYNSDVPCTPLAEDFWQAFAATVQGPEGGYDATSITVAVAGLAGALDANYGEFSEAAAIAHPGADSPTEKNVPPMLALKTLEVLPEGSLGRDLYSMWVDNGFDPEVLDRQAIGLDQMSPALRYLNTRILQMHDVWHLVGGYQTTSLHEIAISSFQLAQFGHNYSAMFLATGATMSHIRTPQGFGLLMQNLAESWQHGRQMPAFMAIEWEDHWHKDIATVRSELGITAFKGSFPADLLEQLAASA